MLTASLYDARLGVNFKLFVTSADSLAQADRDHPPAAAPGDPVTPDGSRAQEATPLGNQGASLPLNIEGTASITKEGVVIETPGGVAQTTTASPNPVGGVAVATVPASVILTLVSPKGGAGNLATTPMVNLMVSLSCVFLQLHVS